MASDKELPVLPLRTGSVRGLDRAKESPYQCVYEDPRALWVHHRKTSQGDAGLGGVYEPAQGHDRRARHYYPQYRQPSRDGHSGLGITVSVSGHGHGPQLRRTAHTLTPRDTLLPPSPESPLEVLPLFARESPLYNRARPFDYGSSRRSPSSTHPRRRAAAANLAGQSYYGPASGEVSPPSSPDAGYPGDPHDVSPIDEVPDMSSLGRPRQSSAPSQPKSNIPMMRRQRRHEQDAANAMLREAKSRERLRSSSLRQPARDGQEASREATGRQVFKVAQGREMRWDAMTGEPTLGSTGLSGQVKPAEYAQGLKAPSAAAASSGPSTAALERLRNAQSSFGEKVKKLTSPTAPAQPPVSPAPGPEPEPESEHVSDASPPVARSESPTSPPPATTTRPPRKSSLGNSTPAPRPEWKGASGRTAIVPPVQDTPQPAPLRIPRKSSKRERYADKGRRGAGGPQSLSPISPSESETSLHRADPTAGKMTSPQQATPSPNLDGRAADEQYPSPPHSGSAPPPSHADPDRVADAKPSSPTTPVSMSMDNAKATRRKPPSSAAAANASHHNPHFSVASSIYSTFDTTTVPHPSGTTNITVTTRVPKSEPVPAPERPAATTPPAQDNWVPPPSRFSITTYATSAHTRSPGASVDLDAPPVPTPPREHTQSLQPKGGASEPADMRKAGALGQDHQRAWPNGAPSIMSERPGSVASTSKALPPAPPEMQTANDRVGYLNARLESLANRRININKSIVKMTELMPTDNLMASDAVLKKREVEKMKVEGLRAELAEVQRMEYELGLKLHRAYKRLDREAEFEPTTLWIRRVTG